MTIEGFDAHDGSGRCRGPNGKFTACSNLSGGRMFNDYGEIIPPEVAGFDAFAIRAMLPSTMELQNSVAAGVGVAGGITVGMGAERFLKSNFSMIPAGAYPFLHVALGAAAGKVLSGINPAIGVGVASGWAGLGFIRFLQQYLNMDISLSDALESADLSSLADLMGDEDLLPPELQGFDQIVIEDEAIGGYDFGNVTVEEQALSGYTYG